MGEPNVLFVAASPAKYAATAWRNCEFVVKHVLFKAGLFVGFVVGVNVGVNVGFALGFAVGFCVG